MMQPAMIQIPLPVDNWQLPVDNRVRNYMKCTDNIQSVSRWKKLSVIVSSFIPGIIVQDLREKTRRIWSKAWKLAYGVSFSCRIRLDGVHVWFLSVPRKKTRFFTKKTLWSCADAKLINRWLWNFRWRKICLFSTCMQNFSQIGPVEAEILHFKVKVYFQKKGYVSILG